MFKMHESDFFQELSYKRLVCFSVCAAPYLCFFIHTLHLTTFSVKLQYVDFKDAWTNATMHYFMTTYDLSLWVCSVRWTNKWCNSNLGIRLCALWERIFFRGAIGLDSLIIVCKTLLIKDPSWAGMLFIVSIITSRLLMLCWLTIWKLKTCFVLVASEQYCWQFVFYCCYRIIWSSSLTRLLSCWWTFLVLTIVVSSMQTLKHMNLC